MSRFPLTKACNQTHPHVKIIINRYVDIMTYIATLLHLNLVVAMVSVWRERERERERVEIRQGRQWEGQEREG